ncbi:MAG: hypothetical protein H6R07_1489 [Proteobacteria bacterium]|nr:hypothetical protein [Pseudomonadota bacterium]
MKNWLAVASAEHVRLGRTNGFMQVCHGKSVPLRRILPGDRVVYYSPTEKMGEGPPLRSFTALGWVQEGLPYQADMGGGFLPWRRDVQWQDAREVPITPLLDTLEFTRGKKNWGYQLRFGLIEISEHDMQCIATAMAG